MSAKALYARGFIDGFKGRPPKLKNAEYMRGFVFGSARRDLDL